MNSGSRQTVLRTLAGALVIAVFTSVATAQTRQVPNGQTSEKIFKNVKSLTGISYDEFMQTMGFLSASLGMNCVDCHVPESGGNWDKYAEETPLKQRSRAMIDRKSTRLNSSHIPLSRMPSSA